MGKIEEMFYDWADDQKDSPKLKEMYKELEDDLTKQIGEKEYIRIEEMMMNCVLLERTAAFQGGFQQATALWKECL